MKEFQDKTKEFLRKIQRNRINMELRKSLINKDFSLFSNNCVGGVISHELGLQFKSPTVNLWMNDSDYIKFLKNIKSYLSQNITEIKINKPYPVGMLGDITLYFQHYVSINEAKKKWEERIGRINWDNLFVMFVTLSDKRNEAIDGFLSLEYQNKAVLSLIEHPDDTEIYFISKAKGIDEKMLGGFCNYISKFSALRYLDEFNYIGWLNGSYHEED